MRVDQIRHASPGPVTASTIASVGRLHAAARLDHCARYAMDSRGHRYGTARGFCRAHGHSKTGRLSAPLTTWPDQCLGFHPTSRMHLHLGERVLDAWGPASATTSEVVRRQALTCVFGCGDRVTVSGCHWLAATRQSRLARALLGRGPGAAGHPDRTRPAFGGTEPRMEGPMRRFALVVGIVVALGLGVVPAAVAANPDANRFTFTDRSPTITSAGPGRRWRP